MSIFNIETRVFRYLAQLKLGQKLGWNFALEDLNIMKFKETCKYV